MVHLHPVSLARCSCRLDLSLGTKKGFARQPDPDGAGGSGAGSGVSQVGCLSSLEWF